MKKIMTLYILAEFSHWRQRTTMPMSPGTGKAPARGVDDVDVHAVPRDIRGRGFNGDPGRRLEPLGILELSNWKLPGGVKHIEGGGSLSSQPKTGTRIFSRLFESERI